MIHLKDLIIQYPNGVYGLSGVNVDVEPGEFVYIVGLTGSGKSTMFKAINAEIKPKSGELTVNGVNLKKIKRRKIPDFRRKIGVIFQDFKLLPQKTVKENLAFVQEVIGASGSEIKQRVLEVLECVELTDKANSFPKELSGGQQQRVAIARAIMNKPALIIADEPTGNLDPMTSDSILNLLLKINEEEKSTIMVVTHDFELIKRHPARTIIIEQGCISGDIDKKRVAKYFKNS